MCDVGLQVTAALETLKPELCEYPSLSIRIGLKWCVCVIYLLTVSPFGRILNIWDITKYIGKWKLAHIKGYHFGTFNGEQAHTNLLKQRELDCKTSVRAPPVFSYSSAPPSGRLSSVPLKSPPLGTGF